MPAFLGKMAYWGELLLGGTVRNSPISLGQKDLPELKAVAENRRALFFADSALPVLSQRTAIRSPFLDMACFGWEDTPRSV